MKSTTVTAEVSYDEGPGTLAEPRVTYRELARVNGRAFSLRVCVSSRPGCGYSELQVWSQSSWKYVWSSAPGAVLTDASLATRKRKAGARSFRADRQRLLSIARAVTQ